MPESTYHYTGIIRRPGDKCDLVPVTCVSTCLLFIYRICLPCAFAGSQLVLDIVDGVPGPLADLALCGGQFISARDSLDKRRWPLGAR